MFCLSTSPSFLPWALSANMQYHHKALCQGRNNLVKETSTLKQKKKKYKPEERMKILVANASQHIDIQKSYIDRMMPAVTLLSSDYPFTYKQNFPQHIPSALKRTTLLKPPFASIFEQFRTFRTRLSEREHAGPSTSPNLSETELLDQVKKYSKALDMNSKESISFFFGLQNGIKMKAAEVKESSLKLSNKFLIAIGLIFLFVLYQTLFKQRNDLNIDMKKDFQAAIPDASFDDVKGIDEVKQELIEVVEFLRDPERFGNLGAKLPKGMLLVGPPGTGKTLLARAIAGEAGVPFFYASGSEFDEIFVGVGSSRIRKLFADAKENSPCVIFIDEIDACGSKRSSSPLQPYARQTINQLLQEMDGFDEKQGVLVLGATNMADVLDKALTRPGRFDTEINVLPPDIKGRKEILELYTNKIIHGDNLDLERVACLTGGMTGADLSNLVNQAAIRAAQLKKSFVEMTDYEYALDRLRMGPELKSRVPTEAELEVTAFHEAGHALVAFYTPNTMPLYKATIRQRGRALGYVAQMPTREDEHNSTCAKLLARIDVAMGGRVAEEILKGKDHVSTGASSDLQSATKIAYEFVCTYGMSENLGFVAYDYEKASPKTKRLIEMEVNNLLEKSYKKAKDLLTLHSDQHKLLAKALIKYETLTIEEINAILTKQSLKIVEKMRNAQGDAQLVKSQNQENRKELLSIPDVM